MLDTSRRPIYESEHELFRDQVRKFIGVHVLPHLDRWERDGIVERALWSACGEAGILCPGITEAHGGLGLDFRYNAIIGEELAYAGSSTGITLQSDVCADYIAHYGSDEQREAWLGRMIAGETVVAIAMTEPGTGSDLQGIRTTARREGEDYVIDGAKTYITNGQHADLVIVVAKTEPAMGAKGISLILVEADRAGFARGRNLDKIGQHASDTSELFFANVRVPASNLIGQEGRGFAYLMQQLPQERLTIAVGAQASAQRAFDEALGFTRERKAFGKAILDFQATRFALAEMATQLQAGWAHLDWAIARHVDGKLTGEEAAAAKLFHSELQNRVCDAALQLHGGAGYMNEYPIARLWRDARVSRIYGGTSEIMKEVIGRAL
ncbi:acyl-CoA dehydrogenase family protein [Novosphingobium profundi]|uniref:acyl-CoA dehydrogenase family protein n=1 Tax=Novosphingobium profundi TaxID=1774954 RepID=UPI001BDB043C|nr:acyl-CoA dehydrogenase family protein [Novosphingobium profundi]MBT0669531.1 acyl-CoA dehydrogenase family protein [Novosphingobium profundi]